MGGSDEEPVAVVTGACGGIGRAVCARLAGLGFRVVGVDRRPAEGAPPPGRLVQADVALPADAERLLDAIGGGEGRVDVLVHNAAIQLAKPLVETTVDEWDAVMASNLRSVFLATRALHPLLRVRGGSIVNVSSVHALATSRAIAAYAASKGALLALTRALAIELAPDRIRVNAVLPGAVDTAMLRAGLMRGHVDGASVDDRLAALAARTVIGRIGQPDEIADAIAFLADGQRSSFITGHGLVVDGGATIRLSTE